MISNKELLNKKRIQKMVSLDITFAAEEADRFIDYIVDESVLKDNARIIKMAKESKNIRALGLGTGRFLKPAATFSSSDYKKELSHDLITLSAKKVRGCIVIFDDDLEDNIEGQAFTDHLLKMIAAKIANELDEAYWIGDTAGSFGSDDIRGLWDGWRYRIINGDTDGDDYYNDVSGGSNILDAESAFEFNTEKTIAEQGGAGYDWEFKFGKMLRTLPSKYKKGGLANLRFFCSDQVVQDYIEALAARSTVLGDNAILGKGPTQYGTVPLISCPLMPTNLATDYADYSDGWAGAKTDCLLTHKGNLIVGIHRDIKMESQREAADEATYFYYSLRADLAIENINALVLTKNLEVGIGFKAS